ncbi:helical cell shape controlling family carboxypeptidase [Desulfobotulus alkaliphilus]|uniref:Helical cell shape controlling family carboxypeptidase n=1 Tax=Desulfobotulus alkaliphilus TaxID=622671 RepID=A0A562RRQ0_9BACT|nr:M14 family metallopeptidase [Desulfobotulus alkaliphilus]TWI71775.1 helical cell shape controlling family carboxypeptidase [Desulfobotulus alkaliphilus]
MLKILKLWTTPRNYVLALALLITFLGVSLVYAQCGLQSWFEDTEHPLDVYRICGKKEGKTLMIIGGIQGDEPGAFLAADHYADMSLEVGRLILIPRANFPAIMEYRRQINMDMNRTFGKAGGRDTYEIRIAKILKNLMGESDLLLNLHDGSGFYSPVWISQERNPLRYGQSLIADADIYRNENGEALDLASIAGYVLDRVNTRIFNDLHRFHFNNHRTLEEDSPHKEQRSSATFYALTRHGIPAFGVETSKSLALEDKINHHIYVINAFMEYMGIVPECPSVRTDSPVLDYLIIQREGSAPVVVGKNEILEVPSGAVIRVSHIVANYSRGLSLRMDGSCRKNLLGEAIVIEKPVRIRVFKDHQPCGSVAVVPVEKTVQQDYAVRKPEGESLFYEIRVNGNPLWIEDGILLDVPHGAVFEIVQVASGIIDPADLVVNFKGFVPPDIDVNTGEDRGYPIDTAKDLWPRFSEDRKGKIYPVETSLKGEKIGGFRIRLVSETLSGQEAVQP